MYSAIVILTMAFAILFLMWRWVRYYEKMNDDKPNWSEKSLDVDDDLAK